MHLVLMPYRFFGGADEDEVTRYLHVIDAYEHRLFSDRVDVIVGVLTV